MKNNKSHTVPPKLNLRDEGRTYSMTRTKPSVEYDLSKYKYLKPQPTVDLLYDSIHGDDSDSITKPEPKPSNKINPIYLKSMKIDLVPKIPTEKYRRRFAVDFGKLLAKKVVLDSETSSAHDSKKLIDFQQQLQKVDDEVLSHFGMKSFNDFSSVKTGFDNRANAIEEESSYSLSHTSLEEEENQSVRSLDNSLGLHLPVIRKSTCLIVLNFILDISSKFIKKSKAKTKPE